MGKLVRRRPCPCGTGRPARDCCGRFRRLSEAEIARSYLSRQARAARDLIGPFSPAALDALQAEAAGLPARYDVFTAAILAAPDAVTTEVRRLAGAMKRQSASTIEGPTPRLRPDRADSPMARVAVTKALVALREEGAIDEHLAAAAVIELAAGPSRLVGAALVEAAITLAGLSGREAPAPTASWSGQPATA